MLQDRKRLVQALWSPFLNQIRSGIPVYFTFHRELLIKVFEENGLGGADPANIINSFAAELVDIDNDAVTLKPEVFEELYTGISSIIIIVAQQILVVEEMVKDQDGFTEEAYFPRLRRAISIGIQEKRHQPYATAEDFESIWRKFQSEILQIGGRASTITFAAGKNSSKNKAYPLSQALLTQDDIFKLVRLIGHDRIFSLSRNILGMEINRFKSRISKRGQKTLAIPFLLDRVYQQIKSYEKYKVPEYSQNTEKSSKLSNTTVRIFKDTVDYGLEEFRVGFFDQEHGRINSDAHLRSSFRVLIRQLSAQFFIHSDIDGAWITTTKAVEIKTGESLVILANQQGKSFAINVMKRFFPKEALSPIWEPVATFEDLHLWSIDCLSSSSQPFKVLDGKLLESPSQKLTRQIEWIGGVCVDERTNKFLLNYLPEKLSVAGIPQLMLGPVKVNGRITTFEVLLDSLNSLVSDQSFEVELLSGVRGTLSIAVANKYSDFTKGYRFLPNRKISPILSELPLGLPLLTGFTATPTSGWRELTVLELALLISDYSECSISVNRPTLDLVIELIRKSSISETLKSLITRKVNHRADLPIALVKSLHINF